MHEISTMHDISTATTSSIPWCSRSKYRAPPSARSGRERKCPLAGTTTSLGQYRKPPSALLQFDLVAAYQYHTVPVCGQSRTPCSGCVAYYHLTPMRRMLPAWNSSVEILLWPLHPGPQSHSLSSRHRTDKNQSQRRGVQERRRLDGRGGGVMKPFSPRPPPPTNRKT
eukprot:2329089-Rhodomonas_salina.3